MIQEALSDITLSHNRILTNLIAYKYEVQSQQSKGYYSGKALNFVMARFTKHLLLQKNVLGPVYIRQPIRGTQ